MKEQKFLLLDAGIEITHTHGGGFNKLKTISVESKKHKKNSTDLKATIKVVDNLASFSSKIGMRMARLTYDLYYSSKEGFDINVDKLELVGVEDVKNSRCIEERPDMLEYLKRYSGKYIVSNIDYTRVGVL